MFKFRKKNIDNSIAPNSNLTNSKFDTLHIFTDKNVKGDINLNCDCILEGEFSGKMVTNGKLIVSKSGKFKGSIFASDILIEGYFEGLIFSKSNLGASANSTIKGKIHANTFNFEDDVNFEGELIQSKIEDFENFILDNDISNISTLLEPKVKDIKIETKQSKEVVLNSDSNIIVSKIKVVKLPISQEGKDEKNGIPIQGPLTRQSWF